MSTISLATIDQTNNSGIQPNSLLEYLYTYLTLDQLRELLNTQPDFETLDLWQVWPAEFKSQVRIAIEYVTHD